MKPIQNGNFQNLVHTETYPHISNVTTHTTITTPSHNGGTAPLTDRSRYLSIHELTTASTALGVNGTTDAIRFNSSSTSSSSSSSNSSIPTHPAVPSNESILYSKKRSFPNTFEQTSTPVAKVVPIETPHSTTAKLIPYPEPETKRYKTQLYPERLSLAQQTGYYRCVSSKHVLQPLDINTINKESLRLENVYEKSDNPIAEVSIDSRTKLKYTIAEGYVPFFEIDKQQHSKYIESPLLFYEDFKHLGQKYGAIQVKIADADNSVEIAKQFLKDLDGFQFKARSSYYNDAQTQIDIISDFYKQLYEYHEPAADENNLKFNKFPTVDKKPLDLFRMYSSVETHGGYEEVCSKKMWLQVGKEMGYFGKIMQSLATTLRSNYLKILEGFEYKFNGDIKNSQNTTINTHHETPVLKDLQIIKEIAQNKGTYISASTYERINKSDVGQDSSYFWHEGMEEYHKLHYEMGFPPPSYTIREMVLKNITMAKLIKKTYEDVAHIEASSSQTQSSQRSFETVVSDPKFFYSVDTGYQISSKLKERFKPEYWPLRDVFSHDDNLLKYQQVDYNDCWSSKYDISMINSYQDWSSKDLGYPSVNHLEYGSNKLWGVIPQSERDKFFKLKNSMGPKPNEEDSQPQHGKGYNYKACTKYHSNFLLCSKPLFENCTSGRFISSEDLTKNGIRHYHVIQTPGTFVFTFDHALSSTRSLGFSVSETASFVTKSWFNDTPANYSLDSVFLMSIYWNGSVNHSKWAQQYVKTMFNESIKVAIPKLASDSIPAKVQNYYNDITILKKMGDYDVSADTREKHGIDEELGAILASSEKLTEQDLQIILFKTYKNGKDSSAWQRVDRFLRCDLFSLKNIISKFISNLKPISFQCTIFSKYKLVHTQNPKTLFDNFFKIVEILNKCPVICSEFEKVFDIQREVLALDQKMSKVCELPEEAIDVLEFRTLLMASMNYGLLYPNLDFYCGFYQRLLWGDYYTQVFEKRNETNATYDCETLYKLLCVGIELSVERKYISRISCTLKETISMNEKIDDALKKRYNQSLKIEIKEINEWLEKIDTERLPVDKNLKLMFQSFLKELDHIYQNLEPFHMKLDCNVDLIPVFGKCIQESEYKEDVFDKFCSNDQRIKICEVLTFFNQKKMGDSNSQNNDNELEKMFKKDVDETKEWMKNVLDIFKDKEHLDEIITRSEKSYQLEFPESGIEPKSIRAEPEIKQETSEVGGVEATTSSIGSGTGIKDTPASNEEKPAEVYCYCRGTDSGNTMVACEICEEWYHIDCVTNVGSDDHAHESDPENNVFICSMCFSGIINLRNYDGIKFSEFQKLLLDYSKLRIIPDDTDIIKQLFCLYKMVLSFRERMMTKLFRSVVKPPVADVPAEVPADSPDTDPNFVAPTNSFELKNDVTIEQCKYFLRKAMGGHCYMLQEIKVIKRFIRKTDINEVNKLKRKKIEIVTGYPLSEQPFKDGLFSLSLDEYFE